MSFLLCWLDYPPWLVDIFSRSFKQIISFFCTHGEYRHKPLTRYTFFFPFGIVVWWRGGGKKQEIEKYRGSFCIRMKDMIDPTFLLFSLAKQVMIFMSKWGAFYLFIILFCCILLTHLPIISPLIVFKLSQVWKYETTYNHCPLEIIYQFIVHQVIN